MKILGHIQLIDEKPKPTAKILANGEVQISYADREAIVPGTSVIDGSSRILFIEATGIPLPPEGIDVPDNFISRIHDALKPKCYFSTTEDPEALIGKAFLYIEEHGSIPDLRQLAAAIEDRIPEHIMDKLNNLVHRARFTTTMSIQSDLATIVHLLDRQK